jgi:hypothetical protein
MLLEHRHLRTGCGVWRRFERQTVTRDCLQMTIETYVVTNISHPDRFRPAHPQDASHPLSIYFRFTLHLRLTDMAYITTPRDRYLYLTPFTVLLDVFRVASFPIGS